MPHERRTIDHVTWWDYVRSVAGASASNAEIARMLDLSPSSVGRWQTSRPDPATAAAFARSYGRPVLEAFVAAGFLSAQDASHFSRSGLIAQLRYEGFTQSQAEYGVKKVGL